MSTPKRTVTERLWDFLCSLKLAVITLILLALTSIIGTVIQQNKAPQEYIQEYGEGLYRLFVALNFTDMYGSWWFVGLLWLFSVNLTACSIKRLPRVWKTVREPLLVPGEDHYRTLSNREEHLTALSPEAARERIAALLGREFSAPVASPDGERIHLYAEKMPWARFGVYVTHASILIIFFGAILGSPRLFGFKGYVNIVEGTSVDQVWSRTADREPRSLGFEVRCDRFAVEYYPNSNRPRLFSSDLVVLEGGQEVVTKTIVVNDPLTYKGYTFYQSSYGPAGEPTFVIAARPRAGGEPQQFRLRSGQWADFGDGSRFRVIDHVTNDRRFGLAVRLEIRHPGENPRFAMILKEVPDFDSRRGGPWIFELKEFSQRQYTGLQVAKDPGVPVVWLGCTLLVLGSCVAFFFSHRRIWVTIMPLKGKTGVVIGGSAHRNQPGFELYFDTLKDKLRSELEA